ncbi:MAG: serine hydrolase [SAR86 cluster bacterium]|uniref:Serine hydrolase n=1 Tax=SAR86 cluster bacterium TaxID=2030880 RepID=A0A2A4MK01_9GAMM|nr:MAG: serine hydrolase [SAR86 cluster bacterium]
MKLTYKKFAAVALLVTLSNSIQAQSPTLNLASTGNTGSASASSFQADFSEFVLWLMQEVDDRKIPGAALAIVSSQGILHLQTWGVRSQGEDEEVNSESIFRIASMSKTFAGTAAAMLVDQNLQTWDTRISALFPSLKIGTLASSQGITLKHIASQSTGLMPHAYSNMLDDGVEYPKIVDKFQQIPTVCEPGKCYGYQNVIFSLISDVVETSTNDSYAHYLELQFFNPLGMTTASVGLEAFKSGDNVTSPHREVRSGWRPTSTNSAYYSVAPASGVNASIEDMSLWVRANLGAFPEVMSPQLLQELHEPVIATPRGNYFNRWQGLNSAHYALGWRVFDYKGLHVIHHGGGVRGYRSEMALVPEANIGMVLLFNAATNLANDVVPAFLDSIEILAD